MDWLFGLLLLPLVPGVVIAARAGRAQWAHAAMAAALWGAAAGLLFGLVVAIGSVHVPFGRALAVSAGSGAALSVGAAAAVGVVRWVRGEVRRSLGARAA